MQSGFYFDLKVGMSCSDDAFESHLAFAKRAVWGSVFNPIYVVRPPISIPGKKINNWPQDHVVLLQWHLQMMKVTQALKKGLNRFVSSEQRGQSLDGLGSHC